MTLLLLLLPSVCFYRHGSRWTWPVSLLSSVCDFLVKRTPGHVPTPTLVEMTSGFIVERRFCLLFVRGITFPRVVTRLWRCQSSIPLKLFATRTETVIPQNGWHQYFYESIRYSWLRPSEHDFPINRLWSSWVLSVGTTESPCGPPVPDPLPTWKFPISKSTCPRTVTYIHNYTKVNSC